MRAEFTHQENKSTRLKKISRADRHCRFGDSKTLYHTQQIQFHRYTSTFLTAPDFGEGGAPDAVGLHAAVEKLLLQTCPLGLGRADLCGGLGFAQLLGLPGGPLGRGLGPALFS